ncbi:hypothetical protein [Winogradskyella sediminis]|uniref:hypothetical protein n=1 Tax=Winogradskyella sediminis TaxID=1382466 RepID=UPI000E2791B7|nr:hypothetical protein [Winogradskyella sediminis]REG87733.1 hypothetical protein C8N41_102578 [Winogradskyella sediminis]
MTCKAKDIVILMTGTIYPNSFETLVLKQPEERKNQYVEAISYYLKETDLKIIFVENSGVSLAKKFETYKKRVEFLTFTALPDIPDKGKGAKELEIINYAFDNSIFIKKTSAIIKVTGRLKVLNINKLTNNFLLINRRQKKLLNCNIYKTKRMDSRCFIFTKDFWLYLKQAGISIDLKYSFEEAVWDSCLAYLGESGVYKQFRIPLSISGVSGGFGTSYDDNLLTAYVKKIRHYLRVRSNYLKINQLIKTKP